MELANNSGKESGGRNTLSVTKPTGHGEMAAHSICEFPIGNRHHLRIHTTSISHGLPGCQVGVYNDSPAWPRRKGGSDGGIEDLQVVAD